jgi:spore maturation protein CgeB
MKKMYIKNHPPEYGAGFWIYRGYAAAWKNIGYQVEFFDNLEEINEKDYYIMTTDGTITANNLPVIERSIKTYLYVQPTSFPDPWGQHPNFQSLCPGDVREKLNTLKNVLQWTYGDVTTFHKGWNNPKTIKLAFDSFNYRHTFDKKYSYDVCFVGGLANNGFNEKQEIMMEYFSAFKEASDQTGLRCGFFINRNLSHEHEQKVLSSSKIAINIHDAYQRKLGLDTNERTFKSLGLNGLLVSDEIKQLENTFPDVLTANNPYDMIDKIMSLLALSNEEILDLKKKNMLNIVENHTYLNRVISMEKM